MHLQDFSSTGPALEPVEGIMKPDFRDSHFSPQKNIPLSAVDNNTYLTAQKLVQQVAFSLANKIFTYSPETFNLDTELRTWNASGERNSYGYTPRVLPLDIRVGAGSIITGYIFSSELGSQGRRNPQHVIGSSALLPYIHYSLSQVAATYQISSPLVLHISASGYMNKAKAGLVTDYVSQLTIANELELGLISSLSAQDVQHMSLLATLLAKVIPMIHTYDGVNMAREITRVTGIFNSGKLHKYYRSVESRLGSFQDGLARNEERVSKLLDIFNDELNTSYKPFEYYGHSEAKTVLVVFGSLEGSLAIQLVQLMTKTNCKVGVINVRIYMPFLEEFLFSEMPKSIQHLLVLGQVFEEAAISDSSVHSQLYSDIFRSIQMKGFGGNVPHIVDVKYATSKFWDLSQMNQLLNSYETMSINGGENIYQGIESSDNLSKQFTIWDVPNRVSDDGPLIVSHILSQNPQQNLSVRSRYDNLVQGGTKRTDIQISKSLSQTAHPSNASDGAFVMCEKLLNEFDVVNGLKKKGFLVVQLPNCKPEELEKRLTVGVRKALALKEIDLYVIDPQAFQKSTDDEKLPSLLLQLCFFLIVEGQVSPTTLKHLVSANDDKEQIEKLSSELSTILTPRTVPSTWQDIEPEIEQISLPTDVSINDFSIFERVDHEPPSSLRDWKTAAKGLLFKQAYGTKSNLRPDLGFKTSVVHVKERRRLTPLSYDRNIFHIEFDLGDSGLTYAIGEALGIHAHNAENEVDDFIEWYGLDATEIVQIPTKEDRSVVESRTVHQALVQNVDIFGRPPKRFYEALADFATNSKERQDLLTLSTSEGATEFQRRAEVDTITFADILQEFPSAHPSFNDLVRIVNPMKRREYSIASSQRVTPNSVSLLIVTVGWIDPKKRSRFGQATRYLNDLVPGTAVTVSVKPSVMKLPQKSTAPIVMAGLGTGLAPFRAFVQEKALQKQQGEDIGSVLLYMGSRHQREEYLYGEEWEAYEKAGVITLLGCAFSRDQPRKIYIQDRMRQSLDDIRQAYLEEEGSFYLCGPTWPVPDVTAVLQEAIEKDAKYSGKKVDSRKEIEQLKEDQRYILEVY